MQARLHDTLADNQREEAMLETNVFDQDNKCFEEGLQKTWTVIAKERNP